MKNSTIKGIANAPQKIEPYDPANKALIAKPDKLTTPKQTTEKIASNAKKNPINLNCAFMLFLPFKI